MVDDAKPEENESVPLSHESSVDGGSAGASHGVSRRKFLTTAGQLLAGSSLAYAGMQSHTARANTPAKASAPIQDRPNILFITTDQERYPQHWPDGWAEANLPAHQRLAANGLSFRRHFCNAAMCSPSRSTLFTGMHPAQHGVIHTLTEGGDFSPQEPTLPEGIQTMGAMLGDAGYNVVLKGKWHMTKGDDGGDPTSDQVAAYGFNEWEPTALANDIKTSNFGGGCANLDAEVAQSAAEFLADQTAAGSADSPFMLVVNLGNPHDVLSYPQSWDQEEEGGCNNYADFDFAQGIQLPPTVHENLQSKPTCQAEMRDAVQASLGPLATPEQWRNYVNFYAGLFKEVDGHIGDILDAIPAEIQDNTIVIFTSDHGEQAMSHGRMRQKAFQVYEETVNVPLIIHNPVLFPEAQETDAYASLLDLMPTLATLAQVPNPEAYTFMGTDLSPLLSAPDQPVQNEILFTFDDIYAGNADGPVLNPITNEEIPGAPKNIRAIFTQDEDGEWKYARYFDPNGEEPEQYEMYQLRDGAGAPVDLNEIDNLANQASDKYDDETITVKRTELAQRLATLEAERLQPLDALKLYMPIVQKSA